MLFVALPEDLQKEIEDPNYLNLLSKLDFKPYTTIPIEFLRLQTPEMRFLCFKYHGMGHYQFVMVNPTRTKEKFCLIIVGGSNDWERKENELQLDEENYCNLYDLILHAYGTKDMIYLSLEEVRKTTDLYDFKTFLFNGI